MKRRLLSGLMAVLMLVNYLPVSVLSAEPQIIGEGTIASETDFVPALNGYCGRESDGTNVEWEINIDNNTLTVVAGFYNEGRQVDLHFEMIDLAESTLALDFEISDVFDSCSLFIVNSAEEMIPICGNNSSTVTNKKMSLLFRE